MNYKLLIAAVAATALMPVGVSASVQTEQVAEHQIAQDQMLVKPSLKVWSERMFRDLNRNLRYPLGIVAMPVNTGVVTVKFQSGVDGTPEQVELVQSSGHRDLDDATMRAVNKVSTLRPFPAGVNGQQNFVVRMMFAESQSDLQKKYAEIREDAANRNVVLVGNQGQVAAVLEIVPTVG